MLSTDISTRAMLASLKITAFSPSKIDKEATSDLLMQAQATDKKAAKVSKALVPHDAMSEIRKINSEARALHYELTLPWSKGGQAMLPSAVYQKYHSEMTRMEIEYEKAVITFMADMPRYIQEASGRLGSLYKADDFPSLEDIKSKFSWEVVIEPMPKADDFRVNLSTELTEELKRQYQERVDEQVKDAAHSLYERAAKVIEHMATSLEEYSVTEVDGKKKVSNTFHSSLVTNIKDLANLLPTLNVTADPALDKLAADMLERLTPYDAEELKASVYVRNDVKKDARAILAEMQDRTGGY